MNDNETHVAFWKVALAWVGATLGSITLSQMAFIATIVFTVLQTFFLLRDKWWRERK